MQSEKSIYQEAWDLIQMHQGTSGQAALAKCVLSLYNGENAFSIGEILWPLDNRYTEVVLGMVLDYAQNGETAELVRVGGLVYKSFPRLVELSESMIAARAAVYKKWESEREEERRLEDLGG